jgi:AcrR family transcriptional regulator
MATDSVTVPSLADEHRDTARQRILRAAQSVLAGRGLAATVDDVAAAAGVSRRTVFRHFATRDSLYAAAIREGIRRYSDRITPPPPNDDLRAWLLDLLLALEPDRFSGELAWVAAERRESRRQFAAGVTARMWQARGGPGRPPAWLADAVAVHLSGFTTQSLTGDFGRTPEEVARLSARVLEAALAAALAAAR